MSSVVVKDSSSAPVRGDIVALVTEYVSTWGARREPLGKVEWGIVSSLSGDQPAYLEGWVAYIDADAVGVVLAVSGPEDMVEMSRLFVCPKYRNRGVARALLACFHEWAAATGAQKTYLFVQTKRTDAKALYYSLGYEDAVITPREKFTEMVRVL